MPERPGPEHPEPIASRPELDHHRLRADCGRCFALCCVGPAFAASIEFAITKPAGQPCPNLGADFRCTIHADLRHRGFSGCTVYDCFGAGQRVAQATFGGRDWRTYPESADLMLRVFAVMRQLHELLWYIGEALELPAATPVHADLDRARAELERLAGGTPEDLAGLDVTDVRQQVGPFLRRASELARAGWAHRDLDLSAADLIGKSLVGADLRGVCLRGALAVGADLRGADLRGADLLGTDVRGADLGGADLSGALFLTQAQLVSANGDRETRLPPDRERPGHWQPRPLGR